MAGSRCLKIVCPGLHSATVFPGDNPARNVAQSTAGGCAFGRAGAEERGTLMSHMCLGLGSPRRGLRRFMIQYQLAKAGTPAWNFFHA